VRWTAIVADHVTAHVTGHVTARVTAHVTGHVAARVTAHVTVSMCLLEALPDHRRNDGFVVSGFRFGQGDPGSISSHRVTLCLLSHQIWIIRKSTQRVPYLWGNPWTILETRHIDSGAIRVSFSLPWRTCCEFANVLARSRMSSKILAHDFP